MWLVFGFIFTFLLGRRPGFFALGSCGKPQRGRKATAPLHTPRAFFRSSWVVVCDTVLTFVCMLRYWMWNVVPRGLQWNCNEVLDVRCTSAEFCSPCGVQQGAAAYVPYSRRPQPMRHIRPRFHNPCGIYSRSSAIYAVYTAGSPQSILCNNISYRNIQSSV